VLPLADRADYAVAGVPAAAVPSARPPGRALVGDEAVECQIALTDAVSPKHMRQRSGAHPPVRVVELPADPALRLPAPEPAGGPALLPLGPGGDEGVPLVMDLSRTGGLLVAGPPGSGRSSAVTAFATHFAAAGIPVLRVAPARRPPDDEPSGLPWAAAGDVAEVRAWVDRLDGRFGVVCVDDIGVPAESAAVLAMPAEAVGLVAAGSAGQLSAHFQGPVSVLRRSRSGLLLCPGAAEADVLGIRLPRTPVPARPGSGWLVTAGTAERVQVARHRTATA
jgi:DNA segregation ATPase FtsK/SpoIIIE, S-DNA-T family